MYSSIVGNQFADHLPAQVRKAVAGTNFDQKYLSALIEAASLDTAAAYAKVPGITKQIAVASEYAVKLAYTEAFKVVYYTALGFAVLAIISALLIRNTDPAKKTLEKAVYLENEKIRAVPKTVGETAEEKHGEV